MLSVWRPFYLHSGWCSLDGVQELLAASYVCVVAVCQSCLQCRLSMLSPYVCGSAVLLASNATLGVGIGCWA